MKLNTPFRCNDKVEMEDLEMESQQNSSEVVEGACNSTVGPQEILDALGYELMASVYCVSLFLTLLMFSYAFYHRVRSKELNLSLTYLQFFPSLLLIPTLLPFFFPGISRLISFTQVTRDPSSSLHLPFFDSPTKGTFWAERCG
ncbi:uncharacterized protein LOC111708178 [Eurytemora carolleeae]|uniref:uncharacterized protein LOC111708178 n=1 Tax=Eurytemora carolleeae TaxID=1294199 RepID=UPI000C75EEF6|nr:uncharacterized protein LOC111708178 [Eurytemora carolleeae]|eukprot:XP_023337244.1 uncharacterized protein LOC111708178 [Eurytemora affinis]